MFGRKKLADDMREEALAAKREAEQLRDKVKERWPEVRKEGSWHRWRRDENHFAADLAKLMKGT